MARTFSSNIIQAIEDGSFFVTGETPIGSIDGVNKTFTLAGTPNPATSLELTNQGAELSVTEDYTLSGDTITMIIAPRRGPIKADYRVTPA